MVVVCVGGVKGKAICLHWRRGKFSGLFFTPPRLGVSPHGHGWGQPVLPPGPLRDAGQDGCGGCSGLGLCSQGTGTHLG